MERMVTLTENQICELLAALSLDIVHLERRKQEAICAGNYIKEYAAILGKRIICACETYEMLKNQLS